MKISIITPSYNSYRYIEKAIINVLNQGYDNWEHIIIDGGSTDGTLDILKKYPHLKWISEPDNGQSDAMNKGFSLTTGDIIGYLNADDLYEKNILKDVVNEFLNNVGIDFIVGNGITVNNDGNQYSWSPEINYYHCLFHYKYTFPYNPISYFYKKQVQKDIGGFNVKNHYSMDLEFLLRLFQNYRGLKINRNFGYFNQTGDNKTSLINPILSCRKAIINHCLKFDKVGLLKYYIDYFIKIPIKNLVFKKIHF